MEQWRTVAEGEGNLTLDDLGTILERFSGSYRPRFIFYPSIVYGPHPTRYWAIYPMNGPMLSDQGQPAYAELRAELTAGTVVVRIDQAIENVVIAGVVNRLYDKLCGSRLAMRDVQGEVHEIKDAYQGRIARYKSEWRSPSQGTDGAATDENLPPLTAKLQWTLEKYRGFVDTRKRLPTNRELAQLTGGSIRTVGYHLMDLRKTGHIAHTLKSSRAP